jgi:HPt (histidine-containing phosphotransfer) domain-containing protein
VGKCFGRYQMFQDMLECLFDEADPLLQRMREALGRGDGEEVHIAAHRLKNTVMYLSAPAALTAILRVERLGRAGALAEAAEAIEDLSRQTAILKDALVPHRKTASPGEEKAKGEM